MMKLNEYEKKAVDFFAKEEAQLVHLYMLKSDSLIS